MAAIQKLLDDYLAYLEIEKNRSVKTRDNYARCLRVFIDMTGARTPSDITEEAVATDDRNTNRGFALVGPRNDRNIQFFIVGSIVENKRLACFHFHLIVLSHQVFGHD